MRGVWVAVQIYAPEGSTTLQNLQPRHPAKKMWLYMYVWAALARHGTGPQKHGPQRHGPQKHISNYGPCRASTCAQSSAHGTTHN
jgi:hypothetical protein